MCPPPSRAGAHQHCFYKFYFLHSPRRTTIIKPALLTLAQPSSFPWVTPFTQHRKKKTRGHILVFNAVRRTYWTRGCRMPSDPPGRSCGNLLYPPVQDEYSNISCRRNWSDEDERVADMNTGSKYPGLSTLVLRSVHTLSRQDN